MAKETKIKTVTIKNIHSNPEGTINVQGKPLAYGEERMGVTVDDEIKALSKCNPPYITTKAEESNETTNKA